MIISKKKITLPYRNGGNLMFYVKDIFLPGNCYLMSNTTL